MSENTRWQRIPRGARRVAGQTAQPPQPSARMGLTHTRTHTYFFDEDQIAALDTEVETLAADWADRRKHIPAKLQQEGDRRVMLLRTAVSLAREEAD